MIKFALTVRVPKSAIIVAAVGNAAAGLALPGDVYVTSGNDGVHRDGSRHYTDEALDFRTRRLTVAQQEAWVVSIRRRLGPEYQAILETDHLHVEWDPRP